jgi:hypothetical protein
MRPAAPSRADLSGAAAAGSAVLALFSDSALRPVGSISAGVYAVAE